MKSLLTTLIFFSVGLISYAQSPSPLPKSIQGHKNNSILATSKNNISQPGNVCPGKAASQGTANTTKPEFSIISIIPTLRLWLLPGNFPNPFSREED